MLLTFLSCGVFLSCSVSFIFSPWFRFAHSTNSQLTVFEPWHGAKWLMMKWKMNCRTYFCDPMLQLEHSPLCTCAPHPETWHTQENPGCVQGSLHGKVKCADPQPAWEVGASASASRLWWKRILASKIVSDAVFLHTSVIRSTKVLIKASIYWALTVY